MIEKIFKLLKPDGYILLSVPARMKLWDTHDEGVGHFRRYEKKELISKLHRSNFEIKYLSSYGYPFLNLLKPLKTAIANRRKKQGKFIKGKKEQTKKSGLNTIKIPLVWIISNRFVLYPLIQFSKIFNSLDKGDGYLCLAKKHNK